MPEFSVETGGQAGAGPVLAGQDDGEGVPVVLLHGLTASRRYVVMGSRSLERSGHRVVAYDARGHGASSPAADYSYAALADDLAAVLDDRGLDRAVLAGASMGAHTIARFALARPERVAGMVLVTPAYDPGADVDAAGWTALARGLREGGVEGFLAAYDFGAMPDAWRDTVATVIRQRLERHEHPGAVADALDAVPRSRPFDGLDELEGLGMPAVVVASRDEADPGHPLATGRAWAERLPDARLVVEEEGRSPIAWQGGQLSKLIAELAARAWA